ncbi:MAG TPA: aldose 1-epimerase family protein [Beijerinckiaceae bacterium]|nr:aldose 1-epimerase family protein [Beijerinckiaceae bacterium]
MSGTIELVADDTRATLALRGAELRSWRVAGRELMWQGDPASWQATSPVLFPICGATNNGVRVGGTTFPLGIHGFAAQSVFAIEAIDNDHVRFALNDDLATRSLYPFDFSLVVEYRIASASIEARLHVRNVGKGQMPYACGFHPGFRWPFGRGGPDDYCIVFDEAESPEVPVIAAGGLFSAQLRRVPLTGRTLNLSAALLAAEALCFLGANSRGLDFVGPDGAIRVDFQNFPHLALWARPPAEFLCVEAWTGYGDPVGYDGDLFAKPSMRILSPGEEAVHGVRFTFAV